MILEGLSSSRGLPSLQGSWLLLVVVSLQEAEEHVPNTCVSVARPPAAMGASFLSPRSSEAALLLFACLSLQAEVWVASFHLCHCSALARGRQIYCWSWVRLLANICVNSSLSHQDQCGWPRAGSGAPSRAPGPSTEASS